jgi:histone H3/H4
METPSATTLAVGERVAIHRASEQVAGWHGGTVTEMAMQNGKRMVQVVFDDATSSGFLDVDREVEAGLLRLLPKGKRPASSSPSDDMEASMRTVVPHAAISGSMTDETALEPVLTGSTECLGDSLGPSGAAAAIGGFLAAAAAVDAGNVCPVLPLEALEHPVTLACGHNFELRSLEHLVQSEEGQKGCPACGADLPSRICVNSEVQKMITIMKQIQRRDQGNGVGGAMSLAATASAIADGVFGGGGINGEEEPPQGDMTKPRAKFEVVCLLGRDTPEVEAMLETRFASLLASVMSKTNFVNTELPLSLTKRLMKQDAFDLRPRTVSADAVSLIEFMSEVFVGFITSVAWQVATAPAKRNTLVLRDLAAAVSCTSTMDFLLDVCVQFGAMLDIRQLNQKQVARIAARRHEKQLAMGRMLSLNPHGSRKLHARRRQRGLHGRFLGSGESDAVQMLSSIVSGDAGPSPSPAGADAPADGADGEEPTSSPTNGEAAGSSSFTQRPPELSTAPAAQREQPPPRDQRRSVFPVANVMRLMGQNLPPGVKVAKDAKECMCELAGEMAAFIAMESSTLAKAAIGLDECLAAFTSLDLVSFVPTVQHWLQATTSTRASGANGTGDSSLEASRVASMVEADC